MMHFIQSAFTQIVRKVQESTSNFLTELVVATAIGGLLTIIGQFIDRLSKRPVEIQHSVAEKMATQAKAADDIAQAYNKLVGDLTNRIEMLEKEVKKIPEMEFQIETLTQEREALRKENSALKLLVEELSRTVESLTRGSEE